MIPDFTSDTGLAPLALKAVTRTKYSVASSNVVCLTPVVMLLPPIVYVRVLGVVTTLCAAGESNVALTSHSTM